MSETSPINDTVETLSDDELSLLLAGQLPESQADVYPRFYKISTYSHLVDMFMKEPAQKIPGIEVSEVYKGGPYKYINGRRYRGEGAYTDVHAVVVEPSMLARGIRRLLGRDIEVKIEVSESDIKMMEDKKLQEQQDF